LLPTVMFPKLRLVGFAASVPGATPVPESAMLSVGLDASEMIVIVPVALPLDCGANVRVNEVLWLGLSVNGVAIPLSSNPVPLTEAPEISTFAAPLFVSVTVWACVAPTVTLPNVALLGLTPSWPTAVAVPFPVSEILVNESDALLVTESVELKLPAALGANLMLIVAVCPAAIVAGRLGVMREKQLVEIAALLIVIDVLPLFVAVTAMVLLLPVGTLPKSRFKVVKERLLFGG
jgi:hypothetical protein